MSTQELEIRPLHDTNRRVEITQQSRPRFEQVYERLIEAATEKVPGEVENAVFNIEETGKS